MRTDTPKTIYLSEYKEPAYLVENINLDFKIFEDKTLVTATTLYKRNSDGQQDLVLNGEHLKLVSVTIDGKEPEHKVDEKFRVLSHR